MCWLVELQGCTEAPYEFITHSLLNKNKSSDFDPLNDEEQLAIYYRELRQHSLFGNHFNDFVAYANGERDLNIVLNLENNFADFIRESSVEVASLKTKINAYFRILNLIETVIVLDRKYSNEHFLQFWRRFNNEYNNIHIQDELIDDVEIYFDNKIGIVPPKEYEERVKQKKPVVSEVHTSYGREYKYNILKVIEKRNQEEEAIEELIRDFEAKIEQFFAYMWADDAGKRVMAKMLDNGSAFDAEEIYDDFAKIYRKFVRRNKELGEFFIRETQDLVNQLCDEFEKSMKTILV